LDSVSLKSCIVSFISSCILPFSSPVIASLVMCPLKPVSSSFRSVQSLYLFSLFLLMFVMIGGNAFIMFMNAGQ